MNRKQSLKIANERRARKPSNETAWDGYVSQINAITKNARAAWLVVLSVLVFMGITLMGVGHIDFYGAGRQVDLPLVDISVPIRLFFITAPLITAAVHAYFNLYLIRLWGVLGRAPSSNGSSNLSTTIDPWLISDAALLVRNTLRGDRSSEERALERPSAWSNLLIAFLFAPLVLGFLWWLSMTSRDLLLSSVAALSLVFSISISAVSVLVLLQKMGDGAHLAQTWPRRVVSGLVLLTAITTAYVTLGKEIGNLPGVRISDVNLAHADVVVRPDDWAHYDAARSAFQVEWCKKPSNKCKGGVVQRDRPSPINIFMPKDPFEEDWLAWRLGRIRGLQRPDWGAPNLDAGPDQTFPTSVREDPENAPAQNTDLRDANFRGAFLVGANLSAANATGASFVQAEMERIAAAQSVFLRTNFGWTQAQNSDMRGSDFERANMSSVRFDSSHFMNATFIGTHMVAGNFSRSIFTQTKFSDVDMSTADFYSTAFNGCEITAARASVSQFGFAEFSGCDIKNSKFDRAQLFSAAFNSTKLSNIDFSGSGMESTFLAFAYIKDSNFSSTDLSNANFEHTFLQKVNFAAANATGARFKGAVLTDVDFSEIENLDFNSLKDTVVDASTVFPTGFLDNKEVPCQWQDRDKEPWTEAQLMGRWKAWNDQSPEPKGWRVLAPEEWIDAPVLPLEDGCEWSTD